MLLSSTGSFIPIIVHMAMNMSEILILSLLSIKYSKIKVLLSMRMSDLPSILLPATSPKGLDEKLAIMINCSVPTS
jgi:hypothetical protein